MYFSIGYCCCCCLFWMLLAVVWLSVRSKFGNFSRTKAGYLYRFFSFFFVAVDR